MFSPVHSATCEHDGLVGALPDGLPLGDGGCDVGTVDLGSGGSAQVVGPLPGGCDQLGSGGCVGSEVLAHVDAGDNEGRLDAAGVESDLLSAEEEAGLDVVDGVAVGPDRVLDGLHDLDKPVLLALDDSLDAHDPASVDESLSVLLEPEDGESLGGVVDPDPLEHAGSVVHGVGEDMDLGVLPVDELAVKPDLLGLIHWIHL